MVYNLLLIYTGQLLQKYYFVVCCVYCRRVWAVILSRAAKKKSWAGRDPTRSIIAADRSVAITGDM